MLEKITLELTTDQWNQFARVMGNLPNASGTWPFLAEFERQVTLQVQTAQEDEVKAGGTD